MIDLRSRNATWVNGVRASRQPLHDGDEIRICGSTYRFVLGAPSSSISISSSGAAGMLVSHGAQPDDIIRHTLQLEAAQVRLRALLDVAQALKSIDDLPALLTEILTLIRSTLPQTHNAAVLLGDSAESLEVAAPAGLAISLSRTVLQEVLTKHNAVLSSDFEQDERFNQAKSLILEQVTGVMAVPLLFGGTVLGVLYVDSPASAFHEDDLDLLNTVAPLMALALHNAELVRQARVDASRSAALSRYLGPDVADLVQSGLPRVMESEGTVFFSDLVGFTSIATQLEPARLFSMLNTYFAAMVGHVFDEGGSIDKYEGDAIMAFWGVLREVDNDARSALRAALRMQNALYKLNAQLQAEGWPVLRMGIGLNSGSFVAGNLGAHDKIEYTVLGDAVNVASRIEALSGPWQVLASAETVARAGGGVSTLWYGDIMVKGRAQAVQIGSVRLVRDGTGWLACVPAQLFGRSVLIERVQRDGNQLRFELQGHGQAPGAHAGILLTALPERSQQVAAVGAFLLDHVEQGLFVGEFISPIEPGWMDLLMAMPSLRADHPPRRGS